MRRSRFGLDNTRIAASFNLAAQGYDDFAKLQRLVGDRLMEHLDVIRADPAWILDIGAGTGYCARALAKRYPKARVLLADIAPSMLVRARGEAPRWSAHAHYVCADAEYLPLNDARIDMVFSNLSIQWCDDLDAVFAQCRRVLKPEGLVLFSTLGPDTLRELREAWAAVDASPHVHEFLDMHDVGDALIRAGFSSPVMQAEMLSVRYQHVLSLMRDLKALGARSAVTDRPRGLTGKRAIADVEAAYERFRVGGALPATYELVYGHAWSPTAGSRPQDGSTVATFPFDRLTVRR
jgi:malonyl-CoA O-methyltransferase